MKSLILVAFATALVFSSGCNLLLTGTPGSGVSATQNRTVDDFHAISVGGVGDVNVSVGGEKSVTVTLDDNLIDMIRTEVVNGELKVRTEGNYRTSIGLKIEVTVPTLDSVSVSGVGDLTATGISGQSFSVSISGVGDALISGEVDKLDLNLSGVGNANLKELKAKSVKVNASGTGDATVYATESVDAKASGVSDITVFGNPKDVKKKGSGIGSVSIK